MLPFATDLRMRFNSVLGYKSVNCQRVLGLVLLCYSNVYCAICELFLKMSMCDLEESVSGHS